MMGAFDDLIPQRKSGLQNYLQTVSLVESGGDPNAINPNSGAAGKYQFIPSTAKAYGLSDPTDPVQAENAMQRFTADNARTLASRLGREPSPSELYLAHQQGAGGALKLLGNPDKPAAQIVGRQAVLQNGGSEDMTASQFAQHVMGLYDSKAASVPAPDVQVTTQTQTLTNPPMMNAAEVTVPQGENPFADLIPEKPKRGSLASFANTFGTMALAPIEQGLQGLTSGLADEAVDYPVAAIKSAISGKPFSQTLEDQRASTLARLASEKDIDPAGSFFADAAGMLGQVALGGGVLGAGKVGPALAKFAESNPLKAASAISALAAGSRGFGEGEDEASRLSGGLLGGGIGAALGPAGVFAGRAISGGVGKASDLVKQAFRIENKAANTELGAAAKAATTQADEVLGNTIPEDKTVAEITAQLKAGKTADELFPKTSGQRTQDVALQRLENDALAGTISPEAERAAQATMVSQNAAYKGYLSKLGGDLDGGRNVNAIIDDVSKTIQGQAGAAKKSVDSAYDLAREYSGGVRKGVQISREDVQKGLWKNIGAARREGQFDVQEMPLAKKALQRLARYSLVGKDKPVTATHLGEMENWRKMVTGFANDAKGTGQGVFLKKMVNSYDRFMEKTAENAVDVGDKEAIMAFRNAVSQRREYGQLFQGNKLVEDIVSGDKSVDDVVKNFIGTGSIKGRKEMANNLSAVLAASKGEAEQVKKDLQNAFAKRIYDRVKVGFEPGTVDRPLLSPAKLKTELQSLFVDQSDFARKLYGDETVKEAEKAIRELTIISSKQPKVGNPSGSGEWVGRLFKSSLGKIPGIGHIGALVADAGEKIKTQTETQKAIQSLSGVTKAQLPDIFAPQAKFWAAATGSTVGAMTKPKKKEK